MIDVTFSKQKQINSKKYDNASITTTTVYRRFTHDKPSELVPGLSETLTLYTTLIVIRFLPTFPARPPLDLGSYTRKNMGKQLKETKNPRTRTHTCFILAYFSI